MSNITNTLIFAGAIFLALLAIGLVFSRLYKRSSKEVSFVRTGFGGQRVIMNGGSLVFPVLHEIVPVNMNTLRLEVNRSDEQALITRDRMRVDAQVEFYVRVQPTQESIANAAQTLGRRTMQPTDLKELVEGKFVDALRAVAAEMAMEELHEQRVNFVQKVQAAVSEDILKNGLELESVSLTGLNQTNRDFFNPQNAFDAEGLTKLTQAIEDRRKKRNDIEQETQVLIERKNLDAEQQKFQISRDKEYARLEQEREIRTRAAEQAAIIAREQAEREREAEQAKILSRQQVREADIASAQIVAEREIAKDRQVQELDIQKQQAVESAAVEKAKQVSLAEQARDIAIAQKSREKSEADAEADRARAIAAKTAEEVITAKENEIAEREKLIQLIEARKFAEQQAIAVVVAADAEKKAAADRAEAVRIAAEAAAAQVKISAEGAAQAEKLRAEGLEAVYRVEAQGHRAVNEAANALSVEQIAMQVRMALIKALPEIIAESVKPIENIDGIKILHVEGLGNATSANGVDGGGSGGIADQAVAAALRYRSQAPLIDALMKELGLQGGDLNGLTAVAQQPATAQAPPSAAGSGSKPPH
ncbi:MAG: flotillin family protein [Bauldia sp.]|nr:flotillin family protein [Bauldia sp.]